MADRYWVGGTASWDGTAGTKWATTSGGSGGASVPTSADNVFINAASGAVTVTIATGNTGCASLNLTGFTGTLAGTAALSIHGSLTLGTGMTRTYTGSLTFRSTTSGNTLTFNGKTMDNTTTFDGIGGVWTVQDTWNNTSAKSITLTNGTLNTNGQTITCNNFNSSNSNARTLTLGASTINCNTLSFLTSTNLTFNANTSTINLVPSSTVTIFQGGGKTFNTVVFAPTAAGVYTITGSNTFANLTITGAATAFQFFDFTYGTTNTITGTFTANGNSAVNRIMVRSSYDTYTASLSAATTSLTNVDFTDISASGGGSWSGTSIGNALGNTGITFTTPVTRYAVVAGNWSSTSTWSASSGGGGGASVPLCHDTVILNASSGAGTYTIDVPRIGANVNCTGFTRTLASTGGTYFVYGDFTLSSGMTYTASLNYVGLVGRSTHTFTTANKTIDQGIYVSCASGKYTLQDDFIQGGTTTLGLILVSGEFDANDNDVTINLFTTALSANTTRTLRMGSGTWNLKSATSTTPWDAGSSLNSNFSVFPETSTVEITGGGTTNRTIRVGSHVSECFNILKVTAGTGTLTITGASTPIIGSFDSTGYTGAMTQTASVVYTGNVTFGTGSTYPASAASITLSGAGTKTITTNGVTIDCSVSITQGTVVFADSFTIGSLRTLTLTAGTLNANNQNVSVGFFSSSGTFTRTLTMGSGTWSITGNSGTVWNTGTATNLTLTSSATLNFTYAGASGTRTINASTTSSRIGAVNITAGTDVVSITALRCTSINFTGFSGVFSGGAFSSILFDGDFTLSTGLSNSYIGSLTYEGAFNNCSFTSNGKEYTSALTISSTNVNTLTLADAFVTTGSIALLGGGLNLNNFDCTCAIFSSSTSTARTLTFGSGDIIVTGNNGTIVSLATTTNLTVSRGTGYIISNYSGSVGTRTLFLGSTGGSESVSLAVKVTAGTDIISIGSSSRVYELDFTGFSGSYTPAALTVYNGLTYSTGMTVNSATGTLSLVGSSGTKTLTTNGKTYTSTIAISAPGAVWQLGSNLVMGTSASLSISAGEFDANDYNVTCGSVVTSNSSTTRMGAGTWEISFNFSPGLTSTLHIETATVKFVGSSSQSIYVPTANTAFPRIWNAQTGTATLTLSRVAVPNTIYTVNTLTCDAGTETIFPTGTTFSISTLTATGSSGNPVIIRGTSTVTPTYINNVGAGNFSVSWCQISNLAAYSSAGNRNYALLTNNNTDGGNSPGWIFTEGLPQTTNILMSKAGTTSAIIDGLLYSDSGASVNRRGFVLGTAPVTDPGNVAPETTDYTIIIDESGTWSSGFYSLTAPTLSANTQYFFRSFAQNADGYSYSSEQEFFTVSYSIDSWQKLHAMRYDPDGSFTLAANLTSLQGDYDTFASSTANGGTGWRPIVGTSGFSGTFNGQNYEIRGLYISAIDTAPAVSYQYGLGLFGIVSSGATLQNIRLRDTEIYDNNGVYAVGSLVGEVGAATITNCHALSPTITSANYTSEYGGLIGHSLATVSESSAQNVLITWDGVEGAGSSGTGGLVGYVEAGSFTECFATGQIFSDDYIGGFAGYAFNSGVGEGFFNCYAIVDIQEVEYQDGNYIGGFVGYTTSTFEKCYAAGVVNSFQPSEDGGFAGIGGGSVAAAAQDNFWDTETSGQSDNEPDVAATGKTTTQMKTITTYTDTVGSAGLTEAWNITSGVDPLYIWNIDPAINFGYPFLAFAESFLDRFYSQSISETVTIAEQVSRTQVMLVNQTENVTITENNSFALSVWIAVIETVSLNEFLVATTQLAPYEEIVTEEYVFAVRDDLSLSVNELITIVDNTQKTLSYEVTINEPIQIIDSPASSIAFVMFIFDVLNVTEMNDLNWFIRTTQLPENRAKGSAKVINLRRGGSI